MKEASSPSGDSSQAPHLLPAGKPANEQARSLKKRFGISIVQHFEARFLALLILALSVISGFGNPVAPLSAVSRKTHGTAGVFDVVLPLTGPTGVECRSGGSSGNHQMIVTFAAPVTFTSASVTSGIADVSSASVSGAIVTVNLNGVANGQSITVTLFGVADGTTSNDVILPMTLVAGDTTGDGFVNSSDISQTKSRSGQFVSASNFRSDVTLDGSINSSDISFVKSKSGTAVNPLAGDALDDPDGDRIPSIYEAANGTSPYNGSSLPAPHLIVDSTIAAETATTKKTIQGAVDAAPDLSTDPNRWTIIEVRLGTYAEKVTIDNRLIFLMAAHGQGDVPTITGGLNGNAITILQGGCVVDGFNIQLNEQIPVGGATQHGVYVQTDTPGERVLLVNCAIRNAYGYSFCYFRGCFEDFSALYAYMGQIRVAHCTFRDNQVAGPFVQRRAQGILVEASAALTLQNSILWDVVGYPEVYVTNGAALTVQNCIIRGGQFGAIDSDPLFTSRSSPSNESGILLSAGSPAINVGASLNVANRDIHGGPRDNQPDLGVDEVNQSDTDADGLSDGWEYLYFGSLDQLAGGDFDGDGLTNLGEEAADTNPRNSDTDGDLMSDGYEVANGLRPLDTTDQLEDPDGDRVPNIYEAANGTLAGDTTSVPGAHLVVDQAIATETATTKKTIQAAIDAAPDVATDPNRWTIIAVRAGTYPESIVISNRRILLLGDSTMPKVTGNRNTADQCLSITQHGVVIDGLLFESRNNYLPGALVNTAAISDRVEFINCVFRGNGGTFSYSTGLVYSGVFLRRGQLRVAHCTFTENYFSAPSNVWGVMLVGDGVLQLDNSIVWNDGASRQFANDSPNKLEIRNSIIKGGEYGGLDLNPRFESSTNGLHHWIRLRNDSPAIDAGAVISVGMRDSTGELRVGLPDLGPTENRPTDSDGDGLADDWEIWHFGDLTHSGNSDEESPSGDGATNLQEFRNFTDPLNADSDGDGMSDGYEIATSLDPVDASDQLLDKDRDRVPNIYEYANNTSANDASQVPVATVTVNPGTGVIQTAVNALPTVAQNPSAWTIVKINPGSYEEAVDLSGRRVLLLGAGLPSPVELRRPASASYNLLITQPGCAIDGVSIVGAERLADPNNATVAERNGGVVITGADVRIANCILRRHIGPALKLSDARALVNHCTIVNNFQPLIFFNSYYAYSGQTVLATNSTLEVQNSIIWNPIIGETRLSDTRADWLRSVQSELGLTNSSIQMSANSIVRYGEQGGGDLDPGVTREGFIMPASPAINRAQSGLGTLADIHGEARDATPDIGADEFVDSDNDHLPDAWERRWFGGLALSATDDPDSDSLNNYGEFVAGTNPNSTDSDGNGVSDLADVAAQVNADPNGVGFRTDSDGDGLIDGLEIISGGNSFNGDTNGDGIGDFEAYSVGLSVGSFDTDGDGLTFAQEITIGTNPFFADTDGDGVIDGVDAFPLDATRWALPSPDPNDNTPPEIFLDVPENAVPVP